MEDTHNMSSDSSGPENFDQIVKACIWCGESNPLENNKNYCVACAEKCFRECCRCHKPYPNKRFFRYNDSRCNACQQKLLAERKKREKSSEIKSPSTVPQEPNQSDEEVDNTHHLQEHALNASKPTTKLRRHKIAAAAKRKLRQYARKPTKKSFTRMYVPIIITDE